MDIDLYNSDGDWDEDHIVTRVSGHKAVLHAREFGDLASQAIDEYFTILDGQFPGEERITSGMLTMLEQQLDGWQPGQVRYQAVHIHQREEGALGGDFALVLHARAKDDAVSKFLLVQAKKYGPSDSVDYDKLIDQCETLMKRTQSAYVVSYAENGAVRFFPAGSVVAQRSISPRKVSFIHPKQFFFRFASCWIGDFSQSTMLNTLYEDGATKAQIAEQLKSILKETNVSEGLAIEAHKDD